MVTVAVTGRAGLSQLHYVSRQLQKYTIYRRVRLRQARLDP
jgi:hypothetical protein